MKPRLRKWRGVWICFLPSVMGSRSCGHGYTAMTAYEDWWMQIRHGWLGRAEA